uniref:Plasma membrane fusion protein PRM1 n=1 Tax=Parascaris univalens TaxID=6257 RepID=A0A914ZTW7_PARUN
MSVDKTIEELSYTLAQLGTLVSHINAQVVGITSRINTTLETFDSSVAGIAVDASALTHQVAFTVAQVPNAWVFYLLFITLIVVFILLSFVLTINIIAKCHGIYRLVKAPRSISSIVSPNSNSEVLPIYDDSKTFVNASSPPSLRSAVVNHIAIPMDYEPRRVGYPVSNGDISNGSHFTNEGDSMAGDDLKQPYHRKPYEPSSGHYNVQMGVALPYSSRGAEV